MNKQIALAYAIAGIAVAIALVVTVGSTESATSVSPPDFAPAQGAEPAPQPTLHSPGETTLDSTGMPEESATPSADNTEAPIEYVYVDQPANKRGGHRVDDDDDDEHGEHDDDEREHEDHERSEHRRRGGHSERGRD